MDIAATDRLECVPTSAVVKPSSSLPISATAALISSRISVGRGLGTSICNVLSQPMPGLGKWMCHLSGASSQSLSWYHSSEGRT
eukprot:11831593-Ditylum_brightwellii.AAC.1